jgi:hypothetical protein
LLPRIYLDDVVACPCGARRYVVAEINERDAIVAILKHLGIDSALPTIARARDRPTTRRDSHDSAPDLRRSKVPRGGAPARRRTTRKTRRNARNPPHALRPSDARWGPRRALRWAMCLGRPNPPMLPLAQPMPAAQRIGFGFVAGAFGFDRSTPNPDAVFSSAVSTRRASASSAFPEGGSLTRPTDVG